MNITNKKTMLVILLGILLVPIVLGVETENPKPSITVTFDEPVKPETIVTTLTNSQGQNFVVIETNRDSLLTTFTYTPESNLPEDTYLFTITAEDVHGNVQPTSQSQMFVVNVGDITISLQVPSYGYSSISVFDLEVKTSRDAECRYAFFDGSFENMQAFDLSNSDIHTISDFQLDQNTQLFVKCDDSYKNVIVGNDFALVLDTTPPVIDALIAQPNPAVQNPPVTIVSVDTDEDTICKYSSNDLSFDAMLGRFDNYDTPTFAQTDQVDLHLPTDATQASYTYYVKCMNKAELVSLSSPLTIGVDLTATLQIVDTNSPIYSSTSSATIQLTTNKNADCFYDRDASFNQQARFGTTGSLIHSTTLGSLSSGDQTYYARCYAQTEQDDETIEITVDTSSPSMDYVNDSNPLMPFNPEFTSDTTQLYGSWLGQDDESGIASYSYTVVDVSTLEIMSSGNTTETEMWISGLNLINNSIYGITVIATNNVGTSSASLNSDGIQVNTSLCNSLSDLNCDDCISFQELITYAERWIQGIIEFNNLIEVANDWVLQDEGEC